MRVANELGEVLEETDVVAEKPVVANEPVFAEDSEGTNEPRVVA